MEAGGVVYSLFNLYALTSLFDVLYYCGGPRY